MSNKLTLSNIEQVIDNHFNTCTNFVFVCGYDLAEYISDYIEDDYDLEDENNALFVVDIDEYYVSVWFDIGKPMFFCENARGLSGKYKWSDAPNCDYFIETDMTEDESDEKLRSDGGTWSWFTIVDEEDCENCEFYDECQEDEDSLKEEERLITECFDVVFGDACIDCSINKIIDLVYTFKALGWKEHQDYIREMNED
jgi:hypothetical protein